MTQNSYTHDRPNCCCDRTDIKFRFKLKPGDAAIINRFTKVFIHAHVDSITLNDCSANDIIDSLTPQPFDPAEMQSAIKNLIDRIETKLDNCY